MPRRNVTGTGAQRVVDLDDLTVVEFESEESLTE